jgi:glycosyltransferase involved in cell wall biosynthesis
LKICFDLRPTQKSSRYTGIGVYTYELGRRLLDEYSNLFFLVRNNCELPFEINQSKLIKVNSFKKPESLQEIIDPFLTTKKLIKNNIDIFHSPIPGYLTSNPHFKVITTVHDVIPEIFPEERHTPFFNHFLYKLKNNKAVRSDFIIFNSNFTQKDFIKLYGKPNKHSIVYLGAEQKIQANFESTFDFSSYGKYIFYIGGFNKRKNFDYILKIFSFLKDKDKLKLVIGGNVTNQAQNRIQNLCKINKVNYDKIYFTGKLNSSDLYNFYAHSYFFLYPSFYEGFGLPVAEALHANSLIFTTNFSSLPEVGGDSVVYINGNDLENDSRIINETLENQNLINDLKLKAKHQKNLFSWNKTVHKTINIYKTVYENIN